MHITNYKQLAKSPLRKKALDIIEAGYGAIAIEKIIKEKISKKGDILEISYKDKKSAAVFLDLKEFKNIYLIGIGKGSALASISIAKILGKRLTQGIALDVTAPKFAIRNSQFSILQGSHPLPSKKNIAATKKIIALAKNAKEDDLVITFICGGGSALACSSNNELNCALDITKVLTAQGADIIELNTVRKHLSEIKGGNLAKLIYPATGISLIVSDVLKNDLSMIASGLTVLDKTTQDDAAKVLAKYNLNPDLFEIYETPKEKKYFEKIKNILFVSNETAADAMAERAKELGLNPKTCSLCLKGEARGVFVKLSRGLKSGDVLIAGGETTVTLASKTAKPGKGGRNQEAVLGALSLIKGENMIVASFASDGHDNTEAAGGMACVKTLMRAKELHLSPKIFLDNHDSFHFFEKTGDLIFAKQNCFNVADLMLIMKN